MNRIFAIIPKSGIVFLPSNVDITIGDWIRHDLGAGEEVLENSIYGEVTEHEIYTYHRDFTPISDLTVFYDELRYIADTLDIAYEITIWNGFSQDRQIPMHVAAVVTKRSFRWL